ncbi:hypothetical protein BH10ACI2_BH10ACI2_07440 [soil metagenome]
MKCTVLSFTASLLLAGALPVFSQKLVSPLIGKYRVPDADIIRLVKAEDARDAAPAIAMLNNVNPAVRYRAALAAGRIGDDKAIDGLMALLSDSSSVEVPMMAAFAIGEIESVKGAKVVIAQLRSQMTSQTVVHTPQLAARLIEAAGKIAAANSRDPVAKELGKVILESLASEAVDSYASASDTYRDFVVAGLTAALRTLPEGADAVVAKFLTSKDARIRGDAGNALSRLRAKNANAALRNMLANDTDAVARSRAASALGAAEDKDAFDILLKAATADIDSRVRVSAIRSLGSLKDIKAIEGLIDHGIGLLAATKGRENTAEKSELLELASALSRIVPNSNNEKVVAFLQSLRVTDRFRSTETEIAMATVAPAKYVADFRLTNTGYGDWHAAGSYALGIRVLAASKDEGLKIKARDALMAFVAGMKTSVKPAYQAEMTKAMPELQGAVVAFKPDNLDQILRDALANDDVNIRASAAGAIDDRPLSKENVEALRKAFTLSLVRDKGSNDAQLAILSALYKLDKKEAAGTLLVALNAPDYLVRKRAFELLADKDLQKELPGISTSLEVARSKHKDQILPYAPAFGTKLGQVLNTNADYRRALSRKDGSVKAVLTTGKGVFTIVFNPEEAPLTVDNFVKLARSGYFNGLEVHRVVANFVMQDGDPRGDGNGGPPWSIRCEVNMLPFDRGAVGMALSGKDTGGSQWFVDHSPAPHLDGGYTVFGHVNEKDMKVVDDIVRGDRIMKVTIVEGRSTERTQKAMSKKK